MDSNKMISAAISMESLDNRSLDNCSTISSLEPHSQVRTLFVSGLPIDCKPRELYLLFRAYPGYESSLLKITNKNGKQSSPVAFVTFASRNEADDVCRKLQGVRFDPENAQTIRLELARSTTKVSKPKQPSPPIVSPANLPTMLQQNLHALAAPAFLPQTQQSDIHNILDQMSYATDPSQLFGLSMGAYNQALQSLPTAGASAQFLHNPLALAISQLQQQQHLNGLLNSIAAPNSMAPPQTTGLMQNNSGNPPCSTLFVANLGANVNEDEVRQLFKSQAGFSRLRMHHKGTSSVAFVEYQNVQCAAMVLLNLQGCQLSNNSSIRIEYAKAKMGESNNNGTSSNGAIKTSI